jgi:hypothetical protein
LPSEGGKESEMKSNTLNPQGETGDSHADIKEATLHPALAGTKKRRLRI